MRTSPLLLDPPSASLHLTFGMPSLIPSVLRSNEVIRVLSLQVASGRYQTLQQQMSTSESLAILSDPHSIRIFRERPV